jgi:hypothetical protein
MPDTKGDGMKMQYQGDSIICDFLKRAKGTLEP